MKKISIYESPYKKIRVGKGYDGGYVICDIPNVKYDFFISGGIEHDITFECNLLSKYPDLYCVAFDGTINALPYEHDRLQFIKKNIGSVSNENMSNLREYFDKYKNIFLKLDIEGGEYELFNSLTNDDFLKIKQLVIEFHPYYDFGIKKRLEKTHWLVHFHGNNCCGVYDSGIPVVYECTYILKDPNSQLNISNDPIPNPLLDMRNDITKPEIILRKPRIFGFMKSKFR